ncbi:MAG: TetR/AcrR family transcriptional regulator [Proteobacteria bacterium]|uniref:TetR/AcrR family transcriptional regulator n=1 Tax=Rudaea sp. TaxID=2136325 RepID=UPI0032200EA6|nr:TetR/AcrR family transcriptional regulator [Pseudomonadota bacterium]
MSLLATPKSAGPGRPKDMEKRAAILDAAKQLFVRQGFEGTSMDAIASKAGVSKLTVYSHYRDKETLFSEAVHSKCETLMPEELFEADLKGPLRKQLLAIARAFFNLITSEDAIAIHRTIVANAASSPKLADLFWQAGPLRVQQGLETFLRAEVGAGKLDIADLHRAASQFFCLLKGELHARKEFGCGEPPTAREIDEHLNATVDLFLRAYAPR